MVRSMWTKNSSMERITNHPVYQASTNYRTYKTLDRLFTAVFISTLVDSMFCLCHPCCLFQSIRYLSEDYMWGESAYVGLALPGETGSWQRENKVGLRINGTVHVLICCRLALEYVFQFFLFCFLQGYQFWTQADKKGSFVIEKIRAADYNLFAWVPGIIGDYKSDVNITITPGMDPVSSDPVLKRGRL